MIQRMAVIERWEDGVPFTGENIALDVTFMVTREEEVTSDLAKAYKAKYLTNPYEQYLFLNRIVVGERNPFIAFDFAITKRNKLAVEARYVHNKVFSTLIGYKFVDITEAPLAAKEVTLEALTKLKSEKKRHDIRYWSMGADKLYRLVCHQCKIKPDVNDLELINSFSK